MRSSFNKSNLDVMANALEKVQVCRNLKIPDESTAPTLRKPHIETAFEKLAVEYDMCPYELRAILTNAPGADNDMVRQAFRKFVMVAKLALDEAELGLTPVREEQRRFQDYYDQENKRHHQRVEERERAITNKQQEVNDSTAGAREKWRKLVEGVQANVAACGEQLNKLPLWDRFFMEAVSNFDGGRYARVTRNRIVINRVNWALMADEATFNQIHTCITAVRSRHSTWLNDQTALRIDPSCMDPEAYEILALLSQAQEWRYEDDDYHPHMRQQEIDHLQRALGWHLKRQRKAAMERVRLLHEAGEEGYEDPSLVANHITDPHVVEEELYDHAAVVMAQVNLRRTRTKIKRKD